MNRGIVWFRNDLRIHDNESLVRASRTCDEIIPVYIFDERIFKGKGKYGFTRTDRFRAQFVIDSVKNLKKNLEKIGLHLYVRVGKPEEEIYELAKTIKSSWIFCNRERTRDEVYVQDELEKNIWNIGQELLYYRGKMLYHTADLPFPVNHAPDVFTTFRKDVEKFISVREPLESPSNLRPISITVNHGKMPSLSDFGLAELEDDQYVFEGGEDAGLARVKEYFWDTDHVQNYYKTRNNLLGTTFSSRFSPYLSLGCLSPKYIYHELKKYEAERGDNKSTYWIFFELLWRDFFRLMAKKHGNVIFQPEGIAQKQVVETVDWDIVNKWINGQTGVPFVDANMIELKRTGFMSNRGRQNVASFLVNDLKQNWLVGAEYFESLLVDYDPCSNYGNWNYLAGVGNDPREERYFNIKVQATKYDAKAEYVKHWLPELAGLSETAMFSAEDLNRVGYHKPMVDFGVWE